VPTDKYFELRRNLADAYPEPNDCRRVAQDIELNVAGLMLHGAPETTWSVILGAVRRERRATTLRAFLMREQASLVATFDACAADFESTPGRYDLSDDDEGGAFDCCEHLGLFDRIDERKLLSRGLRAFKAPPKLNPIAIATLSESADEHHFFVEHATQDLLRRFLGEGARKPQRITWGKNASVTAEDELRDIAERHAEDVDDLELLLGKLGPALAGKALSLAIRSEHLRPDVGSEKLKQFLKFWARLGAHAPPPVLFVNIVRWVPADLALDAAQAIVADALAAVDLPLTRVDPITLSECDISHFDDWHDALVALRKQINRAKYNELTKSFRVRPTFRLGELKERLEAIRIY
jgi:hypothetical protein